jgi:hypothetical protein
MESFLLSQHCPNLQRAVSWLAIDKLEKLLLKPLGTEAKQSKFVISSQQVLRAPSSRRMWDVRSAWELLRC